MCIFSSPYSCIQCHEWDWKNHKVFGKNCTIIHFLWIVSMWKKMAKKGANKFPHHSITCGIFIPKDYKIYWQKFITKANLGFFFFFRVGWGFIFFMLADWLLWCGGIWNFHNHISGSVLIVSGWLRLEELRYSLSWRRYRLMEVVLDSQALCSKSGVVGIEYWTSHISLLMLIISLYPVLMARYLKEVCWRELQDHTKQFRTM
jgi:hypothetical protein